MKRKKAASGRPTPHLGVAGPTPPSFFRPTPPYPKNFWNSQSRVRMLYWLNRASRFASQGGPDIGVGAGGGTTPTEIVLAELLFVLDSSVAVVVAWADGANVPTA